MKDINKRIINNFILLMLLYLVPSIFFLIMGKYLGILDFLMAYSIFWNGILWYIVLSILFSSYYIKIILTFVFTVLFNYLLVFIYVKILVNFNKCLPYLITFFIFLVGMIIWYLFFIFRIIV